MTRLTERKTAHLFCIALWGALATLGCGGAAERAPTTPAPTTELSRPKAVPEEYATITPGLIVPDVAKALAFYQRAFGATVRWDLKAKSGTLIQAELQLGDSVVMLASTAYGGKSPADLGGTSGSLNFYVKDADAMFARALAAGAVEVIPLSNQFWGDRWGAVVDPFGHKWGIGTAVVDLSEDEIHRAAELAFSPGGDEKVQSLWNQARPAKNYVQPGYGDVSVVLSLADPTASMKQYQAFGGTLRREMKSPDGGLLHAAAVFGDAVVMMSQEWPEHGTQSAKSLGASPMYLYVYVDDVERMASRVRELGLQAEGPADMYWGDRVVMLEDASGHVWMFASRQRDMTAAERQTAFSKTPMFNR